MNARDGCRFVLADVFTDRPFGGNALAVFPDAGGLPADVMQAIARELNLSESAFVQPAESSSGSFRVRIFTPAAEVPFAGHPSVGTAAVLAAEGRLGAAGRVVPFTFEEGIGLIAGSVDLDMLTTSLSISPDGFRSGIAPGAADVAAVLTLPPDAVTAVHAGSVGIRFTLARLGSEAAVDRSVLDLEVWRRAFADSWAPQVFAYAGDERPGGTIYARMFAPGLGIAEDPATGSAAVALAASLTMVAPRNGSMVWAIVQGVAMGRPSRITAGAVRSDRGLVGLTLAGQTVIVGEGVIRPH